MFTKFQTIKKNNFQENRLIYIESRNYDDESYEAACETESDKNKRESMEYLRNEIGLQFIKFFSNGNLLISECCKGDYPLSASVFLPLCAWFKDVFPNSFQYVRANNGNAFLVNAPTYSKELMELLGGEAVDMSKENIYKSNVIFSSF